MENTMTTITAPAPQANNTPNNLNTANTTESPINLFQLGCLFVIRASYWSCRIGNDPADFHLAPDEVESKAIASFGSKELIDPHQGRKVFQQLEKQARHQLAKYSKPFPAANAHFVPWEHAPELIDKLEGLKAEFEQAVDDFLLSYPQLRADWQLEHPDVPDAAYPHSAPAPTENQQPVPLAFEPQSLLPEPYPLLPPPPTITGLWLFPRSLSLAGQTSAKARC
jgi:hypothetical protein